MDLTRLSYTHDPYGDVKIGQMLRMLEFIGDSDEARDLYQKGTRWWPDSKINFFRSRMFGLVDRGDFERMERLEREVGR